MRQRLFAAASLAALLASPALADQTVGDTRNSPITTANADGNNNADNIVINGSGRVTLENNTGPAVVLNSNNTVKMEANSQINVNNQSNAIGVELQGGNTGNFDQSGAINLNDDYVAKASADDGAPGEGDRYDSNRDGVINTDDKFDTEVDGVFSEERNKTAILVSGTTPFVGNITQDSSSRISVEGQDSYGIRVQAPVTGNITLAGGNTIVGEDSRGLSIENSVSGNVSVGGTLRVTSPRNAGETGAQRGEGVYVDGDIGGGLRFTGNVAVSGYRISQRSLEASMRLLDKNDDDINGGTAVLIQGSIQNGVFVIGSHADDKDTADINEAQNGASITARGEAPALEIRPGEDATGDVVIGQVNLEAEFDRNHYAGATLDYGVVNDGLIQSEGLFDGKNTTAVLIMGRTVTGPTTTEVRAVIVQGGFQNTGTVLATSYEGDAQAVVIGEHAQVASLNNSGTIRATTSLGYANDGFNDVDNSVNKTDNKMAPGLPGWDERMANEANAIVIRAGSDIERILNDGTIAATIARAGSARAIVVESNSLSELTNTGTISAGVTALPLDLYDADGDGITNEIHPDAKVENYTRVAIDASAQTTGLTITQNDAVTTDTKVPAIVGDIRLGSGDDILDIRAGSITGDIQFGDGHDQLLLSGGAALKGDIDDSDGQLDVTVGDATLTLSGRDNLELSNATFQDQAVLDVTLNKDTARVGDAGATAFVNASGNVTFQNGSDLAVSLDDLIGSNGTYDIITAGTLTVENEETVFIATETPYLYDVKLERNPDNANSIRLTLSRRSAENMGMSTNQAAAYDAAFTAMSASETLSSAFAAIKEANAFFEAYNQLLPEYAASGIQFALASNDASAGALQSRLRNARLAPDAMAGLWVEQFGYYADRSGSALAEGYRGHGVGLAIGFDRPIGPFYAAGVNLVGAASEVQEVNGVDEPFVTITGQVGAYAAADVAGFDVSGYAGIGFDSFESERRIKIGNFDQRATADWTGWHGVAALQAGRDYNWGKWVLRPELGVTYLTLFESGFTENDKNSGIGLIVDDRESTSFTGGASFTLARKFENANSWWMPSLRVGYRHEFGDEVMETTARFGKDGNPFSLKSEQLPGSGLLIGLGLSAGSDYTTFTLGYDADVREDFIRHVARFVLRMTF
ncbi:autotransporter outer membrane beta-barrel domain-containing protein [Woodsholea maritima]|uniref:autotransporter outer membrane beta-barrel domain-containing protein n=1 Tax=Woodsholea maritima TaxID=240237 RepID=UPI00036A8BD4|nr:autotransporter outer membrane beta-barrel domain-containing protein [Woodsholea maritima]